VVSWFLRLCFGDKALKGAGSHQHLIKISKAVREGGTEGVMEEE